MPQDVRDLLRPADPKKAFIFTRTLLEPRSTGYAVLSHGQLIYNEKLEKLETVSWHDHFYPWPSTSDALQNMLSTPQHKLACEARSGEGWNTYFCPVLFSQRRRHKDYAIAPRWLWADLDTADPKEFPENVPQPSIVVQTSPGRFQGFWRLNRRLDPAKAASLCKGIAYAVGGDRSGWDLVQALRVPYTINTKYPDNPEVKLTKVRTEIVEGKKRIKTYSPEQFSEFAAQLINVPSSADARELLVGVEGLTARSVLAKFKDSIKPKANEILSTSPKSGDDRSKRLFELECLLAESGMSPSEIYAVVSGCSWNKFSGRDDEPITLAKDVLKAFRKVEAGEETDVKVTVGDGEEEEEDIAKKASGLFVGAGGFLVEPLEQPGWLIDQLIPRLEQVMVSGEQGTLKSMITTDMAISVATGTPCLGRFKVTKPGKVMLIQEENGPWIMQNRIEKMTFNRGLFDPRNRGLHREILDNLLMLNCHGMDLLSETDKAIIEWGLLEYIPQLIIFDPLYLMLGTANENDATELRPVVKWFMQLLKNYPVSLVVVHHNNKNGVVRGSSVLQAWQANSLSLSHFDKTSRTIKIDRSFRGYGAKNPITVQFELDDPPGLKYKAISKIQGVDKTTAQEKLKDALLEVEDLVDGVEFEELARRTGLSQKTVDKNLTLLAQLGFCTVKKATRGKSARAIPHIGIQFADTEIEVVVDEDEEEDGEEDETEEYQPNTESAETEASPDDSSGDGDLA